MRKLILILSLLIIAMSLQAQPKAPLTAGDYIEKAGSNLSAGIVIPALGACLGIAVIYSTDDKNTKSLGLFIAGTASITGIICQISAASNLMRAGKLFNKENKISLLLNENGAGFRLRFSEPRHRLKNGNKVCIK